MIRKNGVEENQRRRNRRQRDYEGIVHHSGHYGGEIEKTERKTTESFSLYALSYKVLLSPESDQERSRVNSVVPRIPEWRCEHDGLWTGASCSFNWDSVKRLHLLNKSKGL
jgi:hypothetical protein